MKRVLLLTSMLLVFSASQFLSNNASAFPSLFSSDGCTSCHSAPVTSTCDGCHQHGNRSLSASTDKPAYAPGEIVTATLDGGSRGGWIQARLYDQNNTLIASSTGNASGFGGSTTFPATFSAAAPMTAGTYIWEMAYYGNTDGSGHSEVRVSTNSFIVVAPTDPNDVDNDGDGLSENQGDCNDMDAGIFPGASEICGDGIDQDCNGVDLACPPQPTCTDADQDGFSAMTPELDCGPIDCNDEDPAINPGAAERCNDSVDNNCDGLIDGQDSNACPAPPTCTDADMDGFYAEADCNTVQDCDDADAMIFPGAPELCGDRIDNDCDGLVDEGCDMGGNNDGPTLYEINCASCHQVFESSDVCGEDAEEIMEAIAENEGGMSFLSSLTDEQVNAIAAVLADCDDDQDEKEDDDEKKRDRKKRKHKERDDD